MLPEFRERTEIVTVSLKTSDVFYKSISGLLEMFWGWPPGTGKDWEHVLRLPTQEDRLSIALVSKDIEIIIKKNFKNSHNHRELIKIKK